MDVNMDREFAGKLLKDSDIERKVLMPEAARVAQRLEQATRRRTGRTAASTHVEGGHTNAKRDRRAVWVVQSFGAVPMNWRTRQGYMARALR